MQYNSCGRLIRTIRPEFTTDSQKVKAIAGAQTGGNYIPCTTICHASSSFSNE